MDEHSGIKFDNRNPQDWLAGESQWARGHPREVGSERPTARQMVAQTHLCLTSIRLLRLGMV